MCPLKVSDRSSVWNKRSRASHWAYITAYLCIDQYCTLSDFPVVTWAWIVDGPLCRVEFTESIVMYTELAARHER
jgi:hypothetical protein